MRFKKDYLMMFLAVMILLIGCVPPLTDRGGNPVPQKVDYQCKQQCGLYDNRTSIVGYAMCVNDCLRANGY